MNSRERVRRAFHFDRPDRVPMVKVSLGTDFYTLLQFEPRSWQPTTMPPHVLGGDTTLSFSPIRLVAYTWRKKFRKNAGYHKKWWQTPHKSIDEWGVIWQSSGTKCDDKTLGHPVKGPLQENWDNLDNYEIPDANDLSRYRLIRTGIWKILGKNRYVLGSMGVDGIFHRCCHIRGFNNFLIDLVRNPKQVDKLLDKILPFYLIQTERYKEFYPECDAIMVADDLGSQKSPLISPRLFNKFIAPRYKQLIDLTHDIGMDFLFHTCGEIYDLIQPLINIGVDVLEFDSPRMTKIERFKHFAEARKVAFMACADIQTYYTQGTPQEVEDFTKYMIKELGNNEGGFCVFEYPQNYSIGTPHRNVMAMRKATKKWGNYNADGVLDWLA